jgi:alkylation response protein AidB-like acyl-CoA dehydrogenase
VNLELTDAQKEIKEKVREFADEHIAPTAARNDREERFPEQVLKKLAPSGLLTPTLPQEYGGYGTDFIGEACVFEEIGRVDSSVRTILSVHNSLVALTIQQWGTQEQKERLLPDLCRGRALGCFALSEHQSGSDAVNQRTTATPDKDGWILQGEKAWVSSGSHAQLCLTFAQSDPEQGVRGITAFLIPTDTPGFEAQKVDGKMGLRAAHTAHLKFNNVHVPSENMLGAEGQGFKVAMSALDHGRYGVAAGCVGQAQACLDAGVEFLRQRHAFGKPLAKFQLMQEIVADMAVETEAARLLVYQAGHKKNKGEPNTIETSMAKYYATELSVRAARAAIQIHGAQGYTDEFPVERHLRDALATTIYEGTSQIQKLIIGRHLTGESAFA